jgi:hypothetical protein
MKIELTIIAIVLIACIPAILVFLTMTMRYRNLEEEKRQLHIQFLESNDNLLQLETEIVGLQMKVTEKENGVIPFNNKKEKAL